MPVTVTRLENMPILLATFTGQVTKQIMVEMFDLSNELIGEDETHIYRITDVRQATSDFVEMLGAVRAAGQGLPGSTSDPRIKTTFVGTSKWIDFARNALSLPHYGGLKLDVFDNMEDALAHVQSQEDANKSQAS